MAKNNGKKRSVIPWILLITFLAIAGMGGYTVWHYFDSIKPLQSTPEEVKFTVENDATVSSVSMDLEEAGVIQDGRMAYYYARLNKKGTLYAGTYNLDKSWSVEEIFDYLADPLNAQQNTVSVTIVEGDWAKDIALKLSKATNVTYDEYIALWNDQSWIRSQMSRYPFLTDEMFNNGVRIYLEGYLAPETYQFMAETTAEEVTLKILDQTLVVYNKYKDQMAASEFSIHQIYTLASIVQYEAGGSVEDQKLIAGVFINRLHAGWNLESSVTVCYAIDFDKENDNWQACEVNTDYDSVYNTYLYEGLPPGAIENAGEQIIDSVLNYTKSDYLFFMADVYGDGSVHYAETFEEHAANVAQYLGQ